MGATAAQSGIFAAIDTSAPLPGTAARRHTAHRQAIVAVCLFSFISVAGLFAAAGLMQYLFPALAFVTAIFVFWRDRTVYVSFCFWLFFLSPFFRRLVDYRTGWTPTSYVLLAPLLATFVSGYIIISQPRTFARASGVPFACALAAIFYGAVIGFTRYPPLAVVQALVNWIVPICFGFFLYYSRDRYQEFRGAFERSFLYGTLIMGAYGAYQFFVLPQWDRLWMENVDGGPFGTVGPMGARVFSTMNAPAPFATVIMAGLLLLFGLRGRLRIAAAGLGFLAIMFSTSRSSWLGLVVGVGYLASQLHGRQRMRIVGAAFACVLLLLLAVQTPPAQEVVAKRLNSLTDPKNDVSYNQRIVGHEKAFAALLAEPFGEGLGSTVVDHATDGNDDSLGPHDSTVLELLYGIGWIGTLIYVLGLGTAIYRLHGRWKIPGEFGIGLRAILIGYGAQFLLNSVLIGVDGFMVWACLGLCLAGSDRLQQSAEARARALPV